MKRFDSKIILTTCVNSDTQEYDASLYLQCPPGHAHLLNSPELGIEHIGFQCYYWAIDSLELGIEYKKIDSDSSPRTIGYEGIVCD